MEGRKRFAALGTALLLTGAYPIAVDQGWFRDNAYLLPTLLLVAALLYLGFFLTGQTVGSYVAGFRYGFSERHRVLGFVAFTLVGAIAGAVLGAGWWVMLEKSRERIAAQQRLEAPERGHQTPTPTEQEKLDAAIASAKDAPPPKGYESPTKSPIVTKPTVPTIAREGRRGSQTGQKKRLEPPAAAVVYEDHRIFVHNVGETTFYFWGSKLAGTDADIGPEPREIPPRTHYHLYGERLEKYLMGKVDQKGEVREGFDVFLADAQDNEFVVSCTIWLRTVNGNAVIEIQQIKTNAKTWRH